MEGGREVGGGREGRRESLGHTVATATKEITRPLAVPVLLAQQYLNATCGVLVGKLF